MLTWHTGHAFHGPPHFSGVTSHKHVLQVSHVCVLVFKGCFPLIQCLFNVFGYVDFIIRIHLHCFCGDNRLYTEIDVISCNCTCRVQSTLPQHIPVGAIKTGSQGLFIIWVPESYYLYIKGSLLCSIGIRGPFRVSCSYDTLTKRDPKARHRHKNAKKKYMIGEGSRSRNCALDKEAQQYGAERLERALTSELWRRTCSIWLCKAFQGIINFEVFYPQFNQWLISYLCYTGQTHTPTRWRTRPPKD